MSVCMLAGSQSPQGASEVLSRQVKLWGAASWRYASGPAMSGLARPGPFVAKRDQLAATSAAWHARAQAQGVSEATSLAGVVETRTRTSSMYASGSTPACLHESTRE